MTSITLPVRYSAALTLACATLSAVPQGTVPLPSKSSKPKKRERERERERFITQTVYTECTRINYKIVPVINFNKYLHYGTSGNE